MVRMLVVMCVKNPVAGAVTGWVSTRTDSHLPSQTPSGSLAAPL